MEPYGSGCAEKTDVPAEIRQIYGVYLKAAERADPKENRFQRLLSSFRGREEDPCHMRFADELRSCLDSMAAADPDPEDVYAVLDYMYDAPVRFPRPKSANWMLLAVHGFTLTLIPMLRPEDAARLEKRYRNNYPRIRRLPAQNRVLESLRETGAEQRPS